MMSVAKNNVFRLMLLRMLKFLRGRRSYADAAEVQRAELDFYMNYLSKNMIVFDVGANIGDLTLLFLRMVGSEGQVHAFEPSQKTFDCLKKRCPCDVNPNVFLNDCVVTDKEGFARFHMYDDDHSSWNSLAHRPLEKYGIDIQPLQIQDIPSTTIDAYCKKKNITHIDLLKIDVEGAEYQVLQGAKLMLEKKRIRCCVFEFGQTTFDMGNNPDDIRTYLEKCGYSLRNLIRRDPVFPGKDSQDGAEFSIHLALP